MTEDEYSKVMRLAAIKAARDVLNNALDIDDKLRDLVVRLNKEAWVLSLEIDSIRGE